jgi:thiol-disulfide isomerase/thioredoxin
MEADGEKFAKTLEDVLLRNDGTKLGAAAPAAIGGKILGLYFSASWCPPCHAFTPILAEWYTNLKKTRNDFEIVFVSSDKSEQEFQSYSAKMPWLSLDYSARDLKVWKKRKKFIAFIICRQGCVGSSLQCDGNSDACVFGQGRLCHYA